LKKGLLPALIKRIRKGRLTEVDQMIRRIVVGAASLLFGMTACIRAGDIEGVISDSQTGQPLPGVHVSVAGTTYGAASGPDGRYLIRNIPDGEYELIFRIIGYEQTSRQFRSGKNQVGVSDVSLDPQPWELDEVVVTATRREHLLKDVPVTTELITNEEMRETGALTVAEALESHIGVQVNDDLSGKGITMRGVDPSRVLIMVDGRRVVGRVRGSIDLGQLSLSDVDRIEIVKGSGSTLYGSDALGGVINIITRRPQSDGRLDVSGEYGSFGTFDPEFRFEGVRGRFGTMISGKYEKTDGFDLLKDTPHTNGMEKIKRSNIDSKFSFDPGSALQNELTISYMHEQKRWIESEWFEPLQQTFAYDDYEWNDRYDIGLSSRYMHSEETEIEASLHGSYYDHQWEKYTASDVLDDQSITNDDIIEFSLQFNHLFSDRAIMTSGGDFSTASFESDMVEAGKKDVYFGDAYLQFEWLPVSRLTLLPGIRWERHKTYGDHFNPIQFQMVAVG
jgi:outer membrane receptor for ferrienterochelin and colicins